MSKFEYHVISVPPKVKQQIGRFARLVLLGVAAAYVSHSPITSVTVVAIAEVAFRQVFPA